MKCLFDLVATQPLGDSKFHGGGEYSKAVFEGAVRGGYRFDALYDSRKYLDPHIRELCEVHDIPLVDLNGRSYSEAFREYDTFFTGLPYGKFDGAADGRTRLIYTIHGIRSLEMPRDSLEIPFYISSRAYKRILKAFFIRFFPWKYRGIAKSKVQRLLDLPNSQIITVSNHTKYSLLSFFPELEERRLQVCYSPLFNPVLPEEVERIETDVLDKMGLSSGEYYLALGSGRWLKNNLRLARAFDQLYSSGLLKGRKLVLTGGSLSIYRKLKHRDAFLFLDYVESNVLEVLFKNSRALLYPSLNEGFGYPPLQAMKYGTPVLASAFSSVTEVCGDAALYANPYSVDEIKSRILMFENPEIRQRYSDRGPERYQVILNEQDRMLKELLTLIFINP